VSPIAAYLEELAGLLRRGARRRRILAEVRTHLLDAAAAGRERGEAAEAAQHRAVARFGSPPEVARAFNAIGRRRRALVRRAAAVALAGVATASVGTATVWALEPGASSQAHAAVHAKPAGHHHRRHGATESSP
jgi:hypothetical protein